LADAGVDASQVVGLGVTNQRETTVVWNRRTGIPVGRAIVWQDTRTTGLLTELANRIDPADVLTRTGLPMASYFSGAKLRWMLDRNPALQTAAERGELLFGTMDSWITWNLTGGAGGRDRDPGVHITDVTNASRTMLMNLETLDWDDDLITTVAHKVDGEPAVYALEGSVAVAGGLVQWCRDNLGLIRSPAEIETLAVGVPDNGGCYLVPAFSGLFAPHWDNDAQGVLVGLTGFVTKAHIARAVLEATAWQTRDVVDAMNADAGVPALSLAVDGGMTGDNLLMQLVADALDIPVVRPMMAETVALGAAYAAGLAVGYWPDRQVLRQYWQRAGEWRPLIDPDRRTAELASWRHAVSLASAWGRRPKTTGAAP
jgi:glycerol kinase